ILFVQNPSNSSYYSYANYKAKVEEFIAEGGVLVFHDRYVTGAANILPGDPGTFVRRTGTDTTVISNDEIFTNGPGGQLNDTTLDGGSAYHGYVRAETVPSEAVGLLSTES